MCAHVYAGNISLKTTVHTVLLSKWSRQTTRMEAPNDSNGAAILTQKSIKCHTEITEITEMENVTQISQMTQII